MAHSYIAYIDESGDDGLPGHFRQPGGAGGPSHWLAIGATVWRTSRDLDMVQCAKGIIAKLPKPKRGKPLHFTDLDHAQRVMALGEMGPRMFRTTGVFAYKPVIPAGIYVEKNQLYHYMSRYLIERLSWFCRDYRPYVPEGDGRVKRVLHPLTWGHGSSCLRGNETAPRPMIALADLQAHRLLWVVPALTVSSSI